MDGIKSVMSNLNVVGGASLPTPAAPSGAIENKNMILPYGSILSVRIPDEINSKTAHRQKLLLNIDVVNRNDVPVTVKAVNLEIVSNDRVISFRYRENATNTETKLWVEVLYENRHAMQTIATTDLLDVVSTHPLERGIHKSGSLIFRFDELPPSDNLRVRLTLTDAFGDDHVTGQDVEVIRGVWTDM